MELNKKIFEQELISLLEKTTDVHPELIEEFKKLIENQPNDFWGKKSEVAHMTASALVVNESRTEVLLTNHKKLKKWLQLGGHWCDFESYPSTTVLEAAIKEVKEEGYGNEDIPYTVINESKPLDLDIHSVGTHMHYDICFLVEVSKKIPVVVSNESEDVQWISIKRILENKELYDERLVRMCEKTQSLDLSKKLKI